MTSSATLSPRMVTHRMVEDLAKTKAVETTTEEKPKRGRKPKILSAGSDTNSGAAKVKRGRPKKEAVTISSKKARRVKPGPKPKTTANAQLKKHKKPGPKPKNTVALAPKATNGRTSKIAKAVSSAAPQTKRVQGADAVVTLTISGSAQAIKRALAELQG